MDKISIIVPCWNEEAALPIYYKEMSRIIGQMDTDFELIFVDDGSADKTLEEMKKLHEIDARCRYLSFSRNFGKESAMIAGLSYARGEASVIIDCDLQHPPEKIVEMYRLWEQGYKVVEGVKLSRGKEGIFHKWAAGIFYDLISKATSIDMRNASDFKLMDRTVVDTILKMPEKQFFFRAISSWVGFRSTTVEFAVQERTEGVIISQIIIIYLFSARCVCCGCNCDNHPVQFLHPVPATLLPEADGT